MLRLPFLFCVRQYGMQAHISVRMFSVFKIWYTEIKDKNPSAPFKATKYTDVLVTEQ